MTNRVCLLLLVKVGNISEIVNQGMTKFPPGMNAESFAAMTKRYVIGRGYSVLIPECLHS